MVSHSATRQSASAFMECQAKLGQLPFLKVALALVVLVMVGCQGQTFQYSRGWTNGKRSGYPFRNAGSGSEGTGSQSPILEVADNGRVQSVPSADDISVPASGTFGVRGGGGPQGRLRSVDYAQYLTKRMSSTGNMNRKAPMWILGVEQESANPNAEF